LQGILRDGCVVDDERVLDFLLTNVLRAGGVAPRTRMNSASCTAKASQMSFRLNACAACP
jgi:hypothetical protein